MIDESITRALPVCYFHSLLTAHECKLGTNFSRSLLGITRERMATSTAVNDQTIRPTSYPVGQHFRLGHRPALDGLRAGLYLWHFPIFEKVGGWKALGILTVPVAFALTFSIATLSFYLIDTPFRSEEP